jgi:hypothetical protein
MKLSVRRQGFGVGDGQAGEIAENLRFWVVLEGETPILRRIWPIFVYSFVNRSIDCKGVAGGLHCFWGTTAIFLGRTAAKTLQRMTT